MNTTTRALHRALEAVCRDIADNNRAMERASSFMADEAAAERCVVRGRFLSEQLRDLTEAIARLEGKTVPVAQTARDDTLIEVLKSYKPDAPLNLAEVFRDLIKANGGK